MRIPHRRRQRGVRFNITPLVDVVFLLIIFFLVATHFVRSEVHEDVLLPEATQNEEETEEALHRLVITVTADGGYHVGAQQMAPELVDQMIRAGKLESPERYEVRIRSDRSVPYRKVEPIMLTCAQVGVTELKFNIIRP